MSERKRTQLGTEIESGDVVYIRYKDHVLFKDTNASSCSPLIRETIGWIDYENRDYVRIIWDRFAERDSHGGARQKATGLVVLKSGILEMLKFSGKFLSKVSKNIHDVYDKGGHNDNPREEADAGSAQGVRQEGRHLRRCDMGTNERGGKA